MKKTFYVYMLLNLVNGKVYIGKTNNPHKRKLDHISLSKKPNKHRYSLIHKAISKYGSSQFQFYIIQEFLLENESSEAEKYWIKYYKSYVIEYGKEFGYNLTPGGDGLQGGAMEGSKNNNSKLSEEQVKIIKSSTLPTRMLAKEYKVHRTTIQKIRRDNSWDKTIVPNKPSKNDIRINTNKLNSQIGEGSPNSKLTWQLVSEIREKFSNKNISKAELSRQYNVSWTNINSIILNKIWKI